VTLTGRRIGVIGGTGHLGEALARRWAAAGLDVLIGSRDPARAAETAGALTKDTGRPVGSGSNREVAASADLVVVTVPYTAQEATLTGIRAALQGKVVLDTTVPLVPPKVMRVQLPPEGAAALRAQRLLGEGIRVISGFHNVAAHRLAAGQEACDVLVFGDDKGAREAGVELARAAGMRGLHGGALANSAATEALTSVLIFMNRLYGVDGAGIHITGTLKEPGAS